ncbi:MAG: lytic murein transglycosylase [Rickettsiales bacterium]
MPLRSFALLSILVVLMFGASAQAQVDTGFTTWANEFKERAINQGIAPTVAEAAFIDITLDPTVIRLDQKQPEKKITWNKYLSNTVTDGRIERGQQMLADYAEPLGKISKQYGVQAKYIVALWGIESDYGRQQGNFSVIRSLATLAYEGRRAEFFSKELMNALKIIESENIPPDELRGSWAGAMGNCQFMPSTFLAYAVDATGDGHRDIWNSNIDSFASIANYLSSIGWDDRQEWGHKVRVPEDFSTSEADIKRARSVSHWRKRGLTYNGEPVTGRGDLYAIYPGTPEEGAVLVTENFQVLLNWNRSRYFATAVGTLADAIGE